MDVFDYFLNQEGPDKNADLFIHNVGYSHNRPNYSYGYDRRSFYILHYILSGRGTYTVNDKTYSLRQADGFLVPADTTVIYRADQDDPWTVYWVGFSGKFAASLVQKANLTPSNYTFHYDQDFFIRETIENLYQNIRIPNCPQELLVGYLLLIIGKLIHQTCKDRPIVPLSSFQMAVKYIQRSIYSPIFLRDIADNVNLSESQLYRIFIREAGISPHKYLQETKIQKACELIEKTDMTYREISHMLGFEYESHFFKVFKKIKKITPSDYKQYPRKQIQSTPL